MKLNMTKQEIQAKQEAEQVTRAEAEKMLNPSGGGNIIHPPSMTGGSLVVASDAPLGGSEFLATLKQKQRIILPFLKLIQSMSADFTEEGIAPGNFRNSLTGEVLGSTAEIIPVGSLHWRRFFEDRKVLCASNDAITGIGEPGGDCFSCPLAMWRKELQTREIADVPDIRRYRAKAGEKLLSPRCSEQFVFPCLITSAQFPVPAAMVFQRTSFPEGERFGFMLHTVVTPVVYRVTTREISGPRGKWFTLKISISRQMTEAELQLYRHFKTNMATSIVDVEGMEVDEEVEKNMD